jgi:hypothetical protein
MGNTVVECRELPAGWFSRRREKGYSQSKS